MTTMIHNETTGERTFRVPFSGALEGLPYSQPPELEIELARSGEARRVALRFFPTAFEFQARLPKLCQDLGRPEAVFDFGLAAQSARPVVIYEAIPPVRERVPGNIKDLAAVAKFLDGNPALFNMREYRLTAIEFEGGEIG